MFQLIELAGLTTSAMTNRRSSPSVVRGSSLVARSLHAFGHCHRRRLCRAVRGSGACARRLACPAAGSAGKLGGRAGTHVDRETGDTVDNGQHVLAGCYRETFRFLETIGASRHVALQPRLEVGFVDRLGRESVLACPALPSPWHLAAGILGWTGVGWRDRLALRHLLPVLRKSRGASVPAPDETVDRWLRRIGQTDRLVEMLWEPLAVAALNQPIAAARATPFVRVLSDMLGGPSAQRRARTPVDAARPDVCGSGEALHRGAWRRDSNATRSPGSP